MKSKNKNRQNESNYGLKGPLNPYEKDDSKERRLF